MPDKDRCGNCRYCRPMDETEGECHCDPIKALPEDMPGRKFPIRRWPTTPLSEWCGEHKPGKYGGAE